jgi:hypothetical protein
MIVRPARRGATGVIACVALGCVASGVDAQGMPSEKGSVTQTIDGTTITIEYYRPVARGRTPFPDVVHWGRVWTPGANWATTLDIDKPVHLNGNPIPKGKYSVWMIPGRDEWTVVLNRDSKRFHTQPPAASDEELRLAVKPGTGGHMETLTFYFPVVTRDGATLDMHWGTTVIPLRITVAPLRPPDVSASDRARYAGHYRLTPTGMDTTVHEMSIDVTDSGGRLHVEATPPLWGYDPAVDLVPFGHDGEFRLSFYRAGKLFGMEADGQFAFKGDSAGHATGFDFTALSRVIGRASREN